MKNLLKFVCEKICKFFEKILINIGKIIEMVVKIWKHFMKIVLTILQGVYQIWEYLFKTFENLMKNYIHGLLEFINKTTPTGVFPWVE